MARGEIHGAAYAITAHMVGVAINLAIFIAWHVLWPKATNAAPFTGRCEWFALLNAACTFMALWRLEVASSP